MIFVAQRNKNSLYYLPYLIIQVNFFNYTNIVLLLNTYIK